MATEPGRWMPMHPSDPARRNTMTASPRGVALWVEIWPWPGQ